ncbi:MAG: hypothetical protein AAFU83_00245 [Bacteroidota bacterium]
MHQPIRVGIFFGGRAREREISLVGGRTVYDNLDKSLFEPVPIFVDSLGQFILLEWRYLYQGTIRDFYPPSDLIPQSHFQIYIESLGELSQRQLKSLISRIGKPIRPDQFSNVFDIAFLALHGPYGEDGSIQGLLTWYQIPYTGTGILGAALGMNKIAQKKMMLQAGLLVPPYAVLDKSRWQCTTDKAALFREIIEKTGFPLVVKNPCQGSSIGVTIVNTKDTELFSSAVHHSFFIREIQHKQWTQLSAIDKQQWIEQLIDLKTGIGLPLWVHDTLIHHPDTLLKQIDHYFQAQDTSLQLISPSGEEAVLLEAFVPGREFSCIVLQETGEPPVALPPTEIHKQDINYFDYRAKYLPGIVRKETPMKLSGEQLHKLRRACVTLFESLNCRVYARIDGLITADDEIYLNDPNTTAGMNPSSFLFHQAAEIGLNASQLLTFILRNSLAERIRSHKVKPDTTHMLMKLDEAIAAKVAKSHPRHI